MQLEWKAEWNAARRAEEQVPDFTALPLPNSTSKQWHQWQHSKYTALQFGGNTKN
jgi:hypothetical protein